MMSAPAQPLYSPVELPPREITYRHCGHPQNQQYVCISTRITAFKISQAALYSIGPWNEDLVVNLSPAGKTPHLFLPSLSPYTRSLTLSQIIDLQIA